MTKQLPLGFKLDDETQRTYVVGEPQTVYGEYITTIGKVSSLVKVGKMFYDWNGRKLVNIEDVTISANREDSEFMANSLGLQDYIIVDVEVIPTNNRKRPFKYEEIKKEE